MADTFDQSKTATDASQKAALAALATGGTAGKQAYDAAQAQVAAQKQAALAAASHTAGLIGGAEAQSPSFANTVSTPYTAGAVNIGALSGAFQQALALNQAANKNYFGQVNAAIPMERQAALAAGIPKLSDTVIKGKYTQAARDAINAAKAENNQKIQTVKSESLSAGAARDKAARALKGMQSAINDASSAGKYITPAMLKAGYLPGPGVRSSGPAQQNLENAKTAYAAAQAEAVKQTNRYNTTRKGFQAPAFAQTARDLAIQQGVNPDRANALLSDELNSKEYARLHPLAVADAKKYGIPATQMAKVYADFHTDYGSTAQGVDKVLSAKDKSTELQNQLSSIDKSPYPAPLKSALKNEFLRQLGQYRTANSISKSLKF